MADNIERTIYKLEIDDSSYIKGIESLTASTNKLSQSQDAANKTLSTNEAALKNNSEVLKKAKKDLDDYTGSNDRYKKQLEGSVKLATDNQVKLTDTVNQNRKAYEAATKAATDFANTSARAAQLQNNTTGGKIPVTTQPGIQSPVQSIDGIPKNIQEFGQLANAIELAEQRMSVLNDTDEEFKLLAPVVEQGKAALQLYDQATEGASESTMSLRGQLRQAKEELVKLEQAGQAGSKAYIDLELKAAKLTDAFGDQQERIKVLASDTRALDFGKSAITTATSAFQTYASISILAGNESEDLQKKTMQLFAAMQLLTALETLANSVKRGSVLATNLQSASQTVYTAVVGATTGALKAYRIALLATGIGAAVVGIGLLIAAFARHKRQQEEATRDQKLLNDVNKEAISGYASQTVHLNLLRQKLTDLNIPQKERVKLIGEYNKIADVGNQIDKTEINNLDVINSQIDAQIKLIRQRAQARAAENIITKNTEALLNAQLKAGEKGIKLNDVENETIKIKKQQQDAANKGSVTDLLNIQNKVDALDNLNDAQLEVDRSLKVLSPLITTDSLTTTEKGGGSARSAAAKTALENDFEKRKADLLEQIKALAKSEFETTLTIRADYADKLAKAKSEIKILKSVTLEQKEELLRLAGVLNDAELSKALKDFGKKVADAKEKLNKDLASLQQKNTEDQLNIIKDEFDRRAKLIQFNQEKEVGASQQATQDRLDALDLDRLLIGEKAYQDAKAVIVEQGEQEVSNILAGINKQRKDLAADLFKDSLDQFQQFADLATLGLDEDQSKAIRAQSDKFLAGKTTFEQFQKALTKIQKDGESDRRNSDLQDERTKLAVIERRIAETNGGDKSLIKQRDESRRRIADKAADDAIKDAGDKNNDPNKKRVTTVVQYTEAIGGLVDSIISFWQKANEAESQALDKSISLQEKRVEAAQRIAERGNAQYLKQEQDRLNELQVKKENAARREIAINAAIQASQLLVAITGAIAKIADPVSGPAEVIGAIALIIGSLATGYGLVKSLQGSQPKLAKGTRYLTRDGHRSGVDTIPAMLNEGEAVIPTEKNRAYHPTVSAIYDGTIPAETLNNFVRNYHTVKGVPELNYSRIKDTADMRVQADGKLAGLLEENNSLQRQTLKAIKANKVNVSMDQHGFAVTQMEVIEQMLKDKRV